VTIELPDVQTVKDLSPAELRLELACALYSRGRIGKAAAGELAGIDFFSLQKALAERGIPAYTDGMLTDDLASLKALFPQ